MKRINVVGVSGSGKSTFCRQLAQALNIPCVEMDALYWKPNWIEPSATEFIEKVTHAVNGDAWVMDGNYHTKTHKLKWQRADTVIWLNYGFIRTLWQVTKRSILRALDKKELWPGTGNTESFRQTFFSNKSVIWWMITSYDSVQKRYRDAIHTIPIDFPHLRFICLNHPKQAEELLASLKNQADNTLPSSVATSR